MFSAVLLFKRQSVEMFGFYEVSGYQIVVGEITTAVEGV